jgi:asparagine synthase (glutamine-hydrolysing)
MCGIAGIVDFEKPVLLSDIKQMTDIIDHRGPDGDGHWINDSKKVALGHRRLAIIDLSDDGKQPMHYAENRYSITFNGEIYNYLEVKENLQRKGYEFKTKSDTEVLLAAYHNKKEQCLADLDGMFAFAIWDNEEQTLFCARDRFGEKPFHYHYLPNKHFVFASEMKSLWVYGIAKKPRQRNIYNFMGNVWAMTNPESQTETFYENIFKLERGGYAILNAKGELSFKKYWQPSIHINTQITVEQAAEQLYALMEESIKYRLRADVPVGSSLSGGLDSSAIVCLIDKLNADSSIQQKTFSARFPNFDKDESRFMDFVIAKTKATPYATYPDAEKFAADFKKMCWHQEEPFATASIFAQWEVMKLAKEQNVTVLLDGQGADEMLAGYHFYYDSYHQDLYKNDVRTLYQEIESYQKLFGKLPNFVPPFMQKPESTEAPFMRLLRMVYYAGLEIVRKITKTPNKYKQNLNKKPNLSAFHSDFEAQFAKTAIFDYYTPTANFDLNQKLCYDTQSGIEQLLRYADRNSMAHSREVRLPFLYHKLVEFVFTLPPSFKIYQGWTKYVQRKAFEGILPPEITWRKDKIGYEPPQKTWMQQPIIKDLVATSKEKLEREKILNPNRDTTQDIDFAYLTVAQFLE